MKLSELLDKAPEGSQAILESIVITDMKFREYKRILCSISGGSDSDLMIDLCEMVDDSNKIQYVFFDTGLEFVATKEHLKYLEEKYNIKIETIKAIKPIPVCCKEYGVPFLSKQVSEWISRLQRHGFKWEDGNLDDLLEKYPGCRAALRWWCNDYSNRNGRISSFNIEYNKCLKEFMMANPPKFDISNKCCHYAKKKVAENYKKNGGFDLSLYGVRKAEGGVRAAAYKNCFSCNEGKSDEYRPIFWYKAEDKEIYEKHYNIEHSKCYSEYGLKRTGCAGCPYGKNFEEELEAMRMYEPKLYSAANNIFGKSYEYTREYKKFVSMMKEKELNEEQLSMNCEVKHT